MRFKVVERRCYDATYIIDAEDAKEAGKLNGDIVEEDHRADDSWGDSLLSVEEVDKEAEL